MILRRIVLYPAGYGVLKNSFHWTVDSAREPRYPEQLVSIFDADFRAMRLRKLDHVGGAARPLAYLPVPQRH